MSNADSSFNGDSSTANIKVKQAYIKGWNASEKFGATTSATAWNLDRHVDSQIARRTDDQLIKAFEAGWCDYAADNTKYENLR